MSSSPAVMSAGALCFGVAVGYITYRTLVRAERSAVSDLATVVTAVGGGAVTGLFDPQEGDAFGWYSIGLLAGMAVFFLLFLAMNGKVAAAVFMGSPDIGKPRIDPTAQSVSSSGTRRKTGGITALVSGVVVVATRWAWTQPLPCAACRARRRRRRGSGHDSDMRWSSGWWASCCAARSSRCRFLRCTAVVAVSHLCIYRFMTAARPRNATPCQRQARPTWLPPAKTSPL